MQNVFCSSLPSHSPTATFCAFPSHWYGIQRQGRDIFSLQVGPYGTLIWVRAVSDSFFTGMAPKISSSLDVTTGLGLFLGFFNHREPIFKALKGNWMKNEITRRNQSHCHLPSATSSLKHEIWLSRSQKCLITLKDISKAHKSVLKD